MHQSRLVVGIVLVLVSFVISQPIPKSGWKSINDLPAASDSYPRIASFSNGNIIAVYAIKTGTQLQDAQVSFKIFSQNGSLIVPETYVSLANEYSYAPNVITVGDVAAIIWRVKATDGIVLGQFRSNGDPIVPYCAIFNPGFSTNTVDSFGLFALDESTFGVILSPTTQSNTANISFWKIGDSTAFTDLGITASDIPSVFYDNRINTSYYLIPQSNYVSFSGYRGFKYNPLQPVTGLLLSPGWANYIIPFLADSPLVLPYVEVYNTSIIKLRGSKSVTLFDATTTRIMRPDVLPLGSNYALIAHSTTNYSLAYRYVRINTMSADLIGPVITEVPMSSDGVSMTKFGNDVMIAAYNTDHTQVMTRVLTFCGNGMIDFDEQCDSSDSCTTDCTCTIGALAKNGQCLDVCGNGIVTGAEYCDGDQNCDPVTCKCQAGYQPNVLHNTCQPVPVSFVPKVGPALDCLTINSDNSLNLFFSFVSSDSFDQIIQYGAMNDFIPNNIATDRPTFFKSGTSLTYPVSPYNLTVSSTLSLFTWLLGSYNLTVDLSGDKASALQCPKNAGFVMTVATFDTLSDSDVQQLLVNIAHKYNVSTDRLDATYRLSTAGSVSQPNIYSISITILASMNPSDPSAQDILKELYSDLKDSKDQLSSELTQGLSEKNPQIKDVTPNPTGVEVRSQQRDVAPTAVNVGPMPTSGALSSKNQAFWFTVLALLALW